MMFMKRSLWLPRRLEPRDWHPGSDALGHAPKGWQRLIPTAGIQGLASRYRYPQCQQQPLAQHTALLHVRGSGTAKPPDDISLRGRNGLVDELELMSVPDAWQDMYQAAHPGYVKLLQEGGQPQENERRIQKPCGDMGRSD